MAPSPAAEEPGLQNSAARLRSSRDVQARLLAERRGEAGGAESNDRNAAPAVEQAASAESPVKGEAPVRGASAEFHPANPSQKIAKVKLVISYRLPLRIEPEVADIAERDAVTVEYVLRGMARDGREVLREMRGGRDVEVLAPEATSLERVAVGIKTVGEPMTVYVRPDTLAAMHHALGDPWSVMPRATVVGVFFTAIVVRLLAARRAG